MAEIQPQHPSMLGRSRLPPRMTRTHLPSDQRQFLDAFALGIFADCVNNGHTFQAAIAAVYLSGLQNGLALSEPTA